MAVVERVAKITLVRTVPTAATAIYTATAVTFNNPAGPGKSGTVSGVVVTIAENLVSGINPGVETYELQFVKPDGTTIRSVQFTSGAPPFTTTFYFTDTGLVTGQPRAGMVEIKLRLIRANLPIYDVESDGAPNNGTVWVGQAGGFDRGIIRGNPDMAVALSNTGLATAKIEPAQYDEGLYARVTSAATLLQTLAPQLSLSHGGFSTVTFATSTTGPWDNTYGPDVIDSRFPAASTPVAATLIIPNATLVTPQDESNPNNVNTGYAHVAPNITSNPPLVVDPRLTATHHFQVDDNTFDTDDHVPGKQMRADQSGFLATRITLARGGGRNGLTVNQRLTPVKPGSYQELVGSVTATRDGQDGWTALLEWTAAKPGGTWNKTVDVTAPADISADTHLVNSTDSPYVMLVADVRLTRICSGGPTNKDGHFVAGQVGFQAGLSVVQAGTRVRVRADVDGLGGHKAYVAILRLQDTGTEQGFAQFLAADNVTWTPITADEQVIHYHQCVESRSNAGLYLKTWTALQTAGWGTYDIFTIGEIWIDGIPYGAGDKEVGVLAANPHSAYKLDPVDFATGIPYR